jgi:hypothetical protein
MENPDKITKEDLEYRKWVLEQTQRFREDETEIWPGMGSPKQMDMITFWKHHCPKLYQNLKSLKILRQTAYVLQCKTWEQMDRDVAAGMNRSDARLRAEQAWMPMDPEGWDEKEQDEND